MKKPLFRIVPILLLLPLIVLSIVHTSSAQEGQKVGSGLQISPTKSELSIDPGTEKTVKISLKNVTQSDAIAKVAINTFTSDDQTGDPKINPNEEDASPTSIKPFVRGVSEVPLKAGETKEFEINFVVPTTASPGAYYGIIRYQAVPVGTDAPGQISLSASVGTIILLDVPGNVTKSMNLVSLKAGRGDTFSKFFTSSPDKMALEVKNNGNTFIKPFGAVSVANSSGKEVFRYEVNNSLSPGNVLPNTNRVFVNDVKDLNKFGRYTATANIGYEQGGEVLTIKNTFWVVPSWMLIVLGAAIIVIGGGIFFTWRKMRPKRVKRHD